MGGAIGVFLAAAYFRARHYQNAAASPFLRERCRANWGRWRKSAVLLARVLFFIVSKILHFTFYILHFTFGHEILRRCAPQDDRKKTVLVTLSGAANET